MTSMGNRLLLSMQSFFRPPLGAENARMSATEQTKLSWARKVDSYLELPLLYRNYFDSLPETDRVPFPYIVLSPTFKGYIKPAYEKLVVLIKDQICILEQKSDQLSVVQFPIEGIQCLETGTMLLHSWITIQGLNSEGHSTVSTLRFNSVTDYLFMPFINRMRTWNATGNSAGAMDNTTLLEEIGKISYKFMNMAKRSILPGDSLRQTIWQPMILGKRLTLLEHYFPRMLSSAHLVMLTDRELVQMREEKTSRWLKGEPRYGGIWRYFSFRSIRSLSLESREEGIIALRLINRDGEASEMLFAEEKRNDISLLLNNFEKEKTQNIENEARQEKPAV